MVERITPKLDSMDRMFEGVTSNQIEPPCDTHACGNVGRHKVFDKWYCNFHFTTLRDGGVVRHPSSQRFHDILKAIGDLHDKKAADYGTHADPLANVRLSKEWNMPSWVGSAMRADDKMKRLKAFAQKGKLENEPVEDSLLDLAAYAIIALVLYEEETER